MPILNALSRAELLDVTGDTTGSTLNADGDLALSIVNCARCFARVISETYIIYYSNHFRGSSPNI